MMSRSAWFFCAAVLVGCNSDNHQDSNVDMGVPSADMNVAPDSTTPSDDAAIGQERAFSPNDVSVLFPIPTGGADTLWPASMTIDGGPLLDASRFALIGQSVFDGVVDANEYASMRVAALRYDPCFGDEVNGQACVAQIRIVLQSYNAANARFSDGAVHLLFAFDATQATNVEQAFRALTAMAPENGGVQVLGVSPALQQQGMSGAYATALRALIASALSPSKLVRMTFMTRTDADAAQWVFGGFDFDGSDSTPIEIAGLPDGTTTQEVHDAMSFTYGYTVVPNALKDAALLAVLRESTTTAADPSVREAGYAALFRTENPTLENADTTDCASCHMVQNIRSYFDANYGLTPDSTARYTFMDQSVRMSAIGTDADTTLNLRNFGYFMNGPAVSQRIANETHEVLGRLNVHTQ